MRSQHFGKTFSYFLDFLGKDFPLLMLFSETKQDPDWHGEIYLDVHIDMVLKEVYLLISENNFTVEEQDILIFSAIFHDYAKPVTTKTLLIGDKNRVCSPHHEDIGGSLLFFMDPPIGISQKIWLIILEIVSFHHLPKLLVVKNKDKKDYFELSRSVSRIDLLYFFEMADMKGRICSDKQDQLDILDLFRMFCIDYSVWDKSPYSDNEIKILERMPNIDKNKVFYLSEQMSSRFEDGQIWSPEAEIERAFNYINNQNHLVIMVGLPGSGKSKYIQDNYPDYFIVSLDDIRNEVFGSSENQNDVDLIVRIAHERLKLALRDGKNIVWDATNIRRDFREKIGQKGFDYGAFVEIVILHTPFSVSSDRNKSRERVVPSDIMLDMLSKFQMPTLLESHSIKFIPN